MDFIQESKIKEMEQSDTLENMRREWENQLKQLQNQVENDRHKHQSRESEYNSHLERLKSVYEKKLTEVCFEKEKNRTE
jgi:sugar-specific transcriptional regulator TrmB